MRGFSFLEVMIAILLMAVVVSSIMAVVLTVRRDAPRSDRKMAIAFAVRNVVGEMKNYVTADLGVPGPGNPVTNPPNGWGLGSGDSWSSQGLADACSSQLAATSGCSGMTGCSGTQYALDPTCLHHGWISAPNPSIKMTMCYCVGDAANNNSHASVLAGTAVSPTFTPQLWIATVWNENAI